MKTLNRSITAGVITRGLQFPDAQNPACFLKENSGERPALVSHQH
jgi:hypothetical protein